MKKIPVILLILVTGCKFQPKNIETGHLNQVALAEKHFAEVKNILAEDDGRFWGRNLYGPIILIQKDSRIFFANENNTSGEFQPVGKIFTDTLPPEINMSNTAFDWKGKRWSMVLLPLPEENHKRNNLLIHELFHCIQPELGFTGITQQSTSHLDKRAGRILLKLEFEALKSALLDEQGRRAHLLAALHFRKKRQEETGASDGENSLEINEGLSEYTGVMLSGRNRDQLIDHIVKSINDFYKESSYLRAFSYEAIPVYGYLLSIDRPNWHREINKNTALTEYFIRSFDVDLDGDLDQWIEKNRSSYQYDIILKEEISREREQNLKLEKYRKKFIAGPTLKIPVKNMQMAFDYRLTSQLDDYGTVYPSIRISDSWGILTVENGALITADWKYVIVEGPAVMKNELLKGNGWTLELSHSWRLKSTGNHFEIEHEDPDKIR